jgi:cytoskeletal protein RodZ
MPGRLPATLLHGRVRTSTLLLSLLFVAVFALYLEVRPPPAGSAGGSAPAGTRPEPTSPVTATTRSTSTETTSASRSTTSTSRAETTRSTAPTSTTAGATGTSAPSQTTVQP